jgi:hypothetical protein
MYRYVEDAAEYIDPFITVSVVTRTGQGLVNRLLTLQKCATELLN